MKKFLSICTMFFLVVSLAACGDTSDNSSEDHPSEPASTAPVSSQDEASQEVPDQPLYDEAEIIAQHEQVAQACADVIDNFVIDIDEGMYPMPTLEEYTRMSEAIGALGYPVAYYDLDMPNYEKVEAFYNDVQAGKDAQIVIYSLHNTGIYGYLLISRDGGLYGASAIYDFPDYYSEGEPSQVQIYEPLYQVENLHMTENGYLLYQITNNDDGGEIDQAFRVTPLGEENLELRRKYVYGLSYMPGGLLAESWSENNLTALSMIDVFDGLYYRINGDFPTAYTVDIPNDGEAVRQVPADVMEGVMLQSLPMTQEQLRESIPYDESQNEYHYTMVLKSGFATPEVVDSVENADGSRTLTIDAVGGYVGGPTLMTHALTVMDRPDGGIKYLSNEIIKPNQELQ